LKLSPNFVQRIGWTGARISTTGSSSVHVVKVIEASAWQGKKKKDGIRELRSARVKMNNKREGLQLNAGGRPIDTIIKRSHDFPRASSQRRMRRALGCCEGKYIEERLEAEFKCSEVKGVEVWCGREGAWNVEEIRGTYSRMPGGGEDKKKRGRGEVSKVWVREWRVTWDAEVGVNLKIRGGEWGAGGGGGGGSGVVNSYK
jgi:hypothetical protein